LATVGVDGANLDAVLTLLQHHGAGEASRLHDPLPVHVHGGVQVLVGDGSLHQDLGVRGEGAVGGPGDVEGRGFVVQCHVAVGDVHVARLVGGFDGQQVLAGGEEVREAEPAVGVQGGGDVVDVDGGVGLGATLDLDEGLGGHRVVQGRGDEEGGRHGVVPHVQHLDGGVARFVDRLDHDDVQALGQGVVLVQLPLQVGHGVAVEEQLGGALGDGLHDDHALRGAGAVQGIEDLQVGAQKVQREVHVGDVDVAGKVPGLGVDAGHPVLQALEP